MTTLKKYITTKIYLYNYKYIADYKLWTVLKKEFKNFIINNFKQLCIITKTRLYTYLFK
jgi:hypothetical protein